MRLHPLETYNDPIIPLSKKFHMPTLPPVKSADVSRLIPYSKNNDEDYNGTLHFFMDDHKFQDLLYFPRKYVSIAQRYKNVIQPDPSTSVWWNYNSQRFQTFLKQYVGALWVYRGNIKVIPNIHFPPNYKEEEWEFYWDGIPNRSILAVSAQGVGDRSGNKDDQEWFLTGVEQAFSRLNPIKLLYYGGRIKRLEEEWGDKITRYSRVTFIGQYNEPVIEGESLIGEPYEKNNSGEITCHKEEYQPEKQLLWKQPTEPRLHIQQKKLKNTLEQLLWSKRLQKCLELRILECRRENKKSLWLAKKLLHQGGSRNKLNKWLVSGLGRAITHEKYHSLGSNTCQLRNLNYYNEKYHSQEKNRRKFILSIERQRQNQQYQSVTETISPVYTGAFEDQGPLLVKLERQQSDFSPLQYQGQEGLETLQNELSGTMTTRTKHLLGMAWERYLQQKRNQPDVRFGELDAQYHQLWPATACPKDRLKLANLGLKHSAGLEIGLYSQKKSKIVLRKKRKPSWISQNKPKLQSRMNYRDSLLLQAQPTERLIEPLVYLLLDVLHQQNQQNLLDHRRCILSKNYEKDELLIEKPSPGYKLHVEEIPQENPENRRLSIKERSAEDRQKRKASILLPISKSKPISTSKKLGNRNKESSRPILNNVIEKELSEPLQKGSNQVSEMKDYKNEENFYLQKEEKKDSKRRREKSENYKEKLQNQGKAGQPLLEDYHHLSEKDYANSLQGCKYFVVITGLRESIALYKWAKTYNLDVEPIYINNEWIFDDILVYIIESIPNVKRLDTNYSFDSMIEKNGWPILRYQSRLWCIKELLRTVDRYSKSSKRIEMVPLCLDSKESEIRKQAENKIYPFIDLDKKISDLEENNCMESILRERCGPSYLCPMKGCKYCSLRPKHELREIFNKSVDEKTKNDVPSTLWEEISVRNKIIKKQPAAFSSYVTINDLEYEFISNKHDLPIEETQETATGRIITMKEHRLNQVNKAILEKTWMWASNFRSPKKWYPVKPLEFSSTGKTVKVTTLDGRGHEKWLSPSNLYRQPPEGYFGKMK
ncbi:MAG: DUF4417 domain-containing protein [bacterium]|nr:DUF4417 domain-containing protein [bacterium]